MGIVVCIRIQLVSRTETVFFLHTTTPIKLGAVLRQPQSQLYLQHGVAGKEARCPSKQGEVSYSTSWPLKERVLI